MTPRTPLSHAMVLWLRSHKPYELGVLITLAVLSGFGLLVLR